MFHEFSKPLPPIPPEDRTRPSQRTPKAIKRFALSEKRTEIAAEREARLKRESEFTLEKEAKREAAQAARLSDDDIDARFCELAADPDRKIQLGALTVLARMRGLDRGGAAQADPIGEAMENVAPGRIQALIDALKAVSPIATTIQAATSLNHNLTKTNDGADGADGAPAEATDGPPAG